MNILEIKIKKEVKNPYVLYKDLSKADMPVSFSTSDEGIVFQAVGEVEKLNSLLAFLSTWDNKKTDDEQIAEEHAAMKAEIEAVEEAKFLERLEKFLDPSALKAKK